MPKQNPWAMVVLLRQYSPGINLSCGTNLKEEFPYFSTLILKLLFTRRVPFCASNRRNPHGRLRPGKIFRDANNKLHVDANWEADRRLVAWKCNRRAGNGGRRHALKRCHFTGWRASENRDFFGLNYFFLAVPLTTNKSRQPQTKPKRISLPSLG